MPNTPFTEPVIIPCLFTSGTTCEFEKSFVRLIAWVDLPSLPGEPHERRIIARLVLPTDIARSLQRELQQGLKKGSN